MCINIKQDKSKMLKTQTSLFVSFPYDLQKVEKIKKLPKRYYDSITKSWEIPVANINDVIDLFKTEEINIVGKVNTKIQKAAQVKKFTLVSGEDYEFKTTPYPHQVEGFQYGLENPCFLLGDEQGLGKTKQVIDIACARKGQFKHCLIIAGVNSLKWNWLNEIEIHSNEKGKLIGSSYKKGKLKDGSVNDRLADLVNIDKISEYFLVTNIETLRNADIQETLQDLCTSGVIGMVCIDEIHKAKNAQSTQGKSIHKLKSFYRIGATGTPLMNTPLDLYNPLKWLGVEKHSFTAFRNRYADMGGFGGHEVIGWQNLGELRGILAGCQLRRLKAEVLDLPAKVPVTEYVEMGRKQASIYKEIKQCILSEIDAIKANPNPLAQLIRLRQATGYSGILSSTVAESAKIERLLDIIEEKVDNGEKVIVFSNWKNTLFPAIDRFKAEFKGTDYSVITGDTVDRMWEVRKFQTDKKCKVLFGTIGAAGTGLTLTAATNVIFLDEPWNKASKDQAEDRAHRIGTTGTVSIITLVTKDTIDERVMDIVKEKGKYADMLVDGNTANSSDIDMVDFLLS